MPPPEFLKSLYSEDFWPGTGHLKNDDAPKEASISDNSVLNPFISSGPRKLNYIVDILWFTFIFNYTNKHRNYRQEKLAWFKKHYLLKDQ